MQLDGVLALTDAHPKMLESEKIKAALDGEHSVWDIIKLAHEEGIVPADRFESLKAQREEIAPSSEKAPSK